MDDLTKKSVAALCGELWNNAINWSDSYQDKHTAMHIKTDYRNKLIVRRNDILSELERRMNPPEGFVRLPNGKDVKVIGNPPLTADGCFVIPGSGNVYAIINGKVCRNYNWNGWAALFFELDGDPNIGMDPSKCYSTPELAESALAQQT